MLYVGFHDETLWTVYHPGEDCWVAIEAGPTADLVPQTERILQTAMTVVERYYADDQFAVLERVGIRR